MIIRNLDFQKLASLEYKSTQKICTIPFRSWPYGVFNQRKSTCIW